LTTAPEHHVYDIDDAWKLAGAMRKRLGALGFDCVLLVPERCADGQIHFHGAIPGWIDHEVLEACWAVGFVWITKINCAPGTPLRERSRVCASYLTKYLVKDITDRGTGSEGSHAVDAAESAPVKGVTPTCFNGKRYSTSRGTAVRKVTRSCVSMYHAYDTMTALLQCSKVHMAWTSSSQADWDGPPTSIWLEGG